MPAYTLHFLEPEAGRERTLELDCRNDGEACATVRRTLAAGAMELRCGERLVERFAAPATRD